MSRLHLHLLSDSTGETLETIAKAGLAQFEDVEPIKHFWPMVRSAGHLDRVLIEIAARPGLVIYTLVNSDVRQRLETRCSALGLPHVSALDPVIDSLSAMLGQTAVTRPGRQHTMDAAYFDRVEAIHYTIAHDDGIGSEEWEEADVVLAGVSRSSKTPTSIYLANRGYRVANVPLVMESPPPDLLYRLEKPLVVGLTTSPDRLVQIRRNRLLSLNQAPETAYVDQERVAAELSFARRIFADRGWPVIDVTRRSIEETAAAIINLVTARGGGGDRVTLVLASGSTTRRALLHAAGVDHEVVPPGVDEATAKAALASLGGRDLADALAELKAIKVSNKMPGALVLGCDSTVATADGTLLDKPDSPAGLRAQLLALAGTEHRLWSAAVLCRQGAPIWRHVDEARLAMRPLSAAYVDYYVAAEWPSVAGCVGGYRIEGRGAQLFTRVQGSHFTILGLPLIPVLEQLRQLGRSRCDRARPMIAHAEVIGDPISHSKSPLVHGFWLAKLGLAGRYERTWVTAEELPGILAERRADPAWRGCNVTIPHKQAVIPLLDRLDPLAARIGAVNIILPEAGELVGYNSDAPGFLEPLRDRLTERHLLRTARILGSGGAARAVAHALWSEGFTLIVAARDVTKAEVLCAEFGGQDTHAVTLDHFADPLGFAWGDTEGRLDLLVNATSLGMTGQPPLAFHLSHLPPGAIVYDAVYAPLETALLAAARAAGHPTIDGLAMLIGQAAIAFTRFFGAEPPREHDAELRALLLRG